MIDRNTVKHNRGGLILIGLMLILAAINQAIWHKEQVLRYGRSVSLALAPADPGFSVRGDHLALDWQLGRDIQAANPNLPESGKAVLSLPAGLPAKFIRLDDGKPLAADEALIEYRLRNGRVKVVTDAYIFPKGDGAAFEAARYGQFRVAPDGQAMLVGMQDEHLNLIRPAGVVK